ncbi:nose resistant to fluoxetine protein 6, partial [Asbolus verrucosus]
EGSFILKFQFITRPWTVLGRAASLYTDPFIMISGTLTAYTLLGKLQKNGKINILEEYVSRLMRIVPTFAALIAFCTLILPWLSSGPMWNQVVTHHSEICKQYWWRNLLFIHNYFGFKDMCLTHTHHVGIDTQLFFVSPLLVLLLWKWPKKGSCVLLLLALVSTIMRYYVTYTMKLSNYIHFGTSIKQLFDTADNMYILPAHRATVYIMGIFLGFLLRNFRNVALTRGQLRAGNTLALLSFSASFFGPAVMGSIDYVYNPTDAAWYAAFAPILWCFSFGWIIFTAHIGHMGPLERLFSWPLFSLWTKISYTVYLTQFPIFFFNVGVTRTPENYGFFRMVFSLKEFVWIGLMSGVLTILFETPFQNIRNIIFKKKEIKLENVQKKIM